MNYRARNWMVLLFLWALFSLSSTPSGMTLFDLAQARCLSTFSKASEASWINPRSALSNDFSGGLKRQLVEELAQTRWDGDLVHHLFQALRSQSGVRSIKVTEDAEHYYDNGIRYTTPVRHLIQLMRWRVLKNPGYFGHIYQREKKARALQHKISINRFLADHFEAPFQINVTQTKIIYRSLSERTPFVLIESPFQKYFRVLHKNNFQMLNQDHYKASDYLALDLTKSSAKGALRYQETHFDYAPFSINEAIRFKEFGIFTDPIFEPIRDRLLNLD